MSLLAKPLFIKEQVESDVKRFVELRTQQGYTDKSRIMFFTCLHGRKPKEVKVMVSAVKHDPNSIVPFVCILRADGSWR